MSDSFDPKTQEEAMRMATHYVKQANAYLEMAEELADNWRMGLVNGDKIYVPSFYDQEAMEHEPGYWGRIEPV